MAPRYECQVLSDLEVVLPKNVVLACWTLQRGGRTEFLSTNHNKGTLTCVKLLKHLDDSVKINMKVTELQIPASQPEHILIESDNIEVLPDTIAVEEFTEVHAVPVQSHGSPNTTETQKWPVDSPVETVTSLITSNSTVNNVSSEYIIDGTDLMTESEIIAGQDCVAIIETSEVDQLEMRIVDDSQEICTENKNASGKDSIQLQSPIKEQTVAAELNVTPENTNSSNTNLFESSVIQTNSDDQENCIKDKSIDTPVASIESPVQKKKRGRPPKRKAAERVKAITLALKECEADPEETLGIGELDTKSQVPLEEVSEENHSKNQPHSFKQRLHDKHKGNLNCPFCSSLLKDIEYLLVHVKLRHSEEEGLSELISEIHQMMKDGDISEETRDIAVEVEAGEDVPNGELPGQDENESGRRKSARIIKKRPQKRPHYKREQNIKCPFCPSLLKDFESVFEHVRLRHSEEEGYSYFISEIRQMMRVTCDICEKEFSRKDQLTIHIKMMHSKLMPAECSQCGLRVKSARHLRDHVRRIHTTSGKSYLCHLCPASFRIPAYLSAHIKYVHMLISPDAYPCDECSKTYASEKYLRNHKSRVHGMKKYSCQYCQKGFTTATNHRRHEILIHEKTNEKPHACEHCKKRFTLKANLKDHIKTIHFREFSIVCDICQAGFRRKTELESHKYHSHGDPLKVVAVQASKDSEGVTVYPLPMSESQTLVMEQRAGADNTETTAYIIATPEMLQAFGIEMESNKPS